MSDRSDTHRAMMREWTAAACKRNQPHASESHFVDAGLLLPSESPFAAVKQAEKVCALGLISTTSLQAAMFCEKLADTCTQPVLEGIPAAARTKAAPQAEQMRICLGHRAHRSLPGGSREAALEGHTAPAQLLATSSPTACMLLPTSSRNENMPDFQVLDNLGR